MGGQTAEIKYDGDDYLPGCRLATQTWKTTLIIMVYFLTLAFSVSVNIPLLPFGLHISWMMAGFDLLFKFFYAPLQL